MRYICLPLFIFTIVISSSCTSDENSQDFDLQGHRGARGLLPENTIPGFLKAADLGVDTIELDLVVTGDRQLLISHEPWFNHLISTKPNGMPVTEEEQMDYNIFEMTYAEIQQFDVGKRGNPNFPAQTPVEAIKPLFKDAIRTIEKYISENELPPVAYNIETKSNPDQYGIYYPHPDEFAQLLYDELSGLNEEFNLLGRVTVQSFDPATLIEFRKLNEQTAIAMLVHTTAPMESFIEALGFTPEVWSPDYRLITPELILKAHERNMDVIPWTVNTISEMQQLLELGIDGIITDYPDSAAVLR
jgi:glycerophosphoryl diester phosphodiesterase